MDNRTCSGVWSDYTDVLGERAKTVICSRKICYQCENGCSLQDTFGGGEKGLPIQKCTLSNESSFRLNADVFWWWWWWWWRQHAVNFERRELVLPNGTGLVLKISCWQEARMVSTRNTKHPLVKLFHFWPLAIEANKNWIFVENLLMVSLTLS